MLERISAFLEKSPRTKARSIASQLDLDRGEVNRLLHEHADKFEQDDEYRWSLAATSCRIEFSGRDWLTAWHFETSLKEHTPLTSPHRKVVFLLSGGFKPMLDFIARLLAFCNQLVKVGKLVTLDFGGSSSTLTYLNRVGFFDVLDKSISVLPERPTGDLAKTFHGNNKGLIEFSLIDPANFDENIPTQLRDSFVACAGASYSQGAFTILAELFDNVREHSDSGSPGFACLQFYRNSGKIQAVISDNGRGIVGTLGPVVPQKYPAVARKMASAPHAGVALLTEVFRTGDLSQVDADGRGVGLKRSGDLAEKFKAKISVRQNDFELRIHHADGAMQFSQRLDLAPLAGTHVCFEFKLDASVKSA
jgi:anti-sigma regulatory factor (Ser/Thr protein kinase)